MITLIAACTENGVIGRDGDMPWHLPGELRTFKQATMGRPLVIGRTTWESIGRPLPGRRMVVVTRQADYAAEGVEIVHSIDDALALVRDAPEVMIGGGATLYQATIAHADRLLLTVIHTTLDGDTWFPDVAADSWAVHRAEPVEPDDQNPLAYTRFDLRRRPPGGIGGPLPNPFRRR